MKIRTILPLLVVAAGLLTLSGNAQPAPTRAPVNAAAAPASCDDKEAKAKLYKKFLDHFKGDPEQQKVAYDAGREYISKYGDCPGEHDRKVAAYIRKWLAKYEEAVREWERWKSRQP